MLQFDLRVNAGTPAGTVISNQAVVDSVELPDLPTDGDGNPATGPEPTVVVVGNSQQLSITKQVVVVGGGAAVPGAQLEYVVRVTNIAAVPAINVVITDNLNASQPGQLAYVSGSATMNGSAAGVTFAGSTITANYGAVSRTARARRGRGAQVPGHSRPQPGGRHGRYEHRRGRLEPAHANGERQRVDHRRRHSRLRRPERLGLA